MALTKKMETTVAGPDGDPSEQAAANERQVTAATAAVQGSGISVGQKDALIEKMARGTMTPDDVMEQLQNLTRNPHAGGSSKR